MKSKSLILMIVSLGFGLIAAVGISQVMGRNNTQQPVLQTGTVIVPTKDMELGELLSDKNCKTLDYPIRLIPEGAITNLDQIKDMATRQPMRKELPILVSQVVHKDQQGELPIPKGKKVCSIKVSAADMIDGLLRPGDRIDLVGIFKVRRDRQNLTMAKTFLKNITVFSAGGKMTNSGIREPGGSRGGIISVLVSPQQAEMLLLVQKSAQLSIILRGKEAADEPEGVSDDAFLAKFFQGADYSKPEAEEGEKKEDGMESFMARALAARTEAPQKSKKMRIWYANEAVTFTFGEKGELPTSDVKPIVTSPNGSSGAPPSNPGVAPGSPGNPPPGSTASNNAGNSGLNRSSDIDRSLEEDQYPGE